MQIHNVKPGETVEEIAKQYTVKEESIRITNELNALSPAPGEELLILIPTRTYTVQYGDTPERICLRFGIRSNDIEGLNPQIDGKLRIGEEITLRYADRPLGMAVANGYFYKGCTEKALKRAMPYLTYVTFASVAATEKGLVKLFNDSDTAKWVKEKSKIPLVRIYDRVEKRFKSRSDHSKYAEEIIELALSCGYKGIVLDACSQNDSAEEFTSFIVDLRKMMIGCDLILITEVNEHSPAEFSEYADSSVIYYPKYAMNDPVTFDKGEKRLLEDFACKCESAKTFIDLPSLASKSGSIMKIEDALNIARLRQFTVDQNKSTLLSHFCDRRQGDYRFISLSGIKALFELINEYDYMGICFDIMRTPMSHIMMYNSLFKTSYHTYVRSREGCSRADAE